MTTERTEKKTILTPVGRLINEALFEKDQFNDEATACYKIEMAKGYRRCLNLEAGHPHAQENLVRLERSLADLGRFREAHDRVSRDLAWVLTVVVLALGSAGWFLRDG